jgi:hypothetical protein
MYTVNVRLTDVDFDGIVSAHTRAGDSAKADRVEMLAQISEDLTRLASSQWFDRTRPCIWMVDTAWSIP